MAKCLGLEETNPCDKPKDSQMLTTEMTQLTIRGENYIANCLTLCEQYQLFGCGCEQLAGLRIEAMLMFRNIVRCQVPSGQHQLPDVAIDC